MEAVRTGQDAFVLWTVPLYFLFYFFFMALAGFRNEFLFGTSLAVPEARRICLHTDGFDSKTNTGYLFKNASWA